MLSSYRTDARDAVIHWCHCRRDADIFHQDSAPAHHARQTNELLQRETTKFIGLDLWTSNNPEGGQVINYYVANFFSILCAEYCRNRPAFVETTVE